jgi:hypothetical protein
MCGHEYDQQKAWYHLQAAGLDGKQVFPRHKTVRGLVEWFARITRSLQRGVACLTKR